MVTFNKPAKQHYETLGVENGNTLQQVDAKYEARCQELEGNNEALEALYDSYSVITEYLYSVWGSDYEDKKPVMEQDDNKSDTDSEPDTTTCDIEYVNGYQPEVEEEDAEKTRAKSNTLKTCWKCKTCLKTFASKQMLEKHENKRFKCVAPKPSQSDEENTNDKKFVCVCGKSYKNASHLSRHKTTCSQCIKNMKTLDAVKNDTFKLNSFGSETLTYNNTTFEKCFKEANTSTRRFEIEHFSRTKAWSDYRKLMLGFIKQMFFTTPENYSFYIPNMSEDFVWIHKNGKRTSIKKDDLTTHMIKVAISEFGNILFNTADANEDIEELVKYHPIEFMSAKVLHQDDDVCVQTLLKSVKLGIMAFAMNYKDDIKRVWTKAGLY
jgi:hypothetical protein